MKEGERMTVEFWTGAERFYEFWFFILSLLFLLLVVVFLFALTYTSKKNRKKVMFWMTSTLVAVGLIGLYGHSQYYPYLEQASYTNPLIRDREPRLHIYIPYPQAEQTMFEQLNDLKSLRQMVLYKEENVAEPLTYLGQDTNYYYFEHEDGRLFKETFHIEFRKETDQAYLKGSLFVLKDETFKEIGFKNPKNIMYDKIIIPVTEQDKIFNTQEEDFISRTEKVFQHWNF